MHIAKMPAAVRLLGFSGTAAAQLAALLAAAPRGGPRYACLHEDSLQEPDLVLVDGDAPGALACLDEMRSPPPALVVGGAACTDYTQIAAPPEPAVLYPALAKALDEHQRMLAQQRMRGMPVLAERRRQWRLGGGCPEAQARRRSDRSGKVLIVDKGGAFRDHLARLVDERRLPIAWTDSAMTAVRLCDETPVALAMINTATPGIDPYVLSQEIKAQDGAQRTAVVLLVGPGFAYDSVRARDAGVRGLLDKPVGDRCLVAALQRLAALPA